VICNLLAVTGGKQRSEAEWDRLLARSGLTLGRAIPSAGDLAPVVEAGLGTSNQA
jgi:hypothetical protein